MTYKALKFSWGCPKRLTEICKSPVKSTDLGTWWYGYYA